MKCMKKERIEKRREARADPRKGAIASDRNERERERGGNSQTTAEAEAEERKKNRSICFFLISEIIKRNSISLYLFSFPRLCSIYFRSEKQFLKN